MQTAAKRLFDASRKCRAEVPRILWPGLDRPPWLSQIARRRRHPRWSGRPMHEVVAAEASSAPDRRQFSCPAGSNGPVAPAHLSRSGISNRSIDRWCGVAPAAREGCSTVAPALSTTPAADSGPTKRATASTRSRVTSPRSSSRSQVGSQSRVDPASCGAEPDSDRRVPLRPLLLSKVSDQGFSVSPDREAGPGPVSRFLHRSAAAMAPSRVLPGRIR